MGRAIAGVIANGITVVLSLLRKQGEIASLSLAMTENMAFAEKLCICRCEERQRRGNLKR
ncbi:hypothetical protein [Syntrophomonas palmitatica]|uniref:hypothetical protein n=1 Tax=Syntrophomonas palmitatica TaxID=402877 RepID=UPI0012EE58C3|nr:hypothetical protein [Syntrophomonas palmitatica]